MPKNTPTYVQTPIAVVGMACRLPGDSNSPHALWSMLKEGRCADIKPPKSRFNIKGHYDGSAKPGTMRPPGGMFLENIDPRYFDAPFFEIGKAEAISMDPQQRQLLETVYEGMENAGLTLENLNGSQYGCFVGSFAVDYGDMQSRDPEDRPESIVVGQGRAILSNRISHFLNIRGPSMTLDTACSGSLIGVDVACRYLNAGEIEGAVVAGSNLYMSPEHVMDTGPMRLAHSPTGKCHTFDAEADGYIKAEAVNVVVLKRLSDALRDRDPIRAVIRGTSTNSDGRTPGIASPSSEAQAAAIRAAYRNANISDLSQTTYLECHGTGTQAGDPTELSAAASVFEPSRKPDSPLIVGSVKSNVGHSEPAAGLSGLIKSILAVENCQIPGNATLRSTNPKIDFEGLKMYAPQRALKWPEAPIRRASVNSFGYGGSNCHVIVENPEPHVSSQQIMHVSSYATDEELFQDGNMTASGSHLLVFSGNDENSLRSYFKKLTTHFSNLEVSANLRDLAYTLSEKRSHHFHRGYVIANSSDLDNAVLHTGKVSSHQPRIGFAFTGQGAQWSQMGQSIVKSFPLARQLLFKLDAKLQSLSNPPSWSLIDELTQPRSSDHLQLPEFSQPLVTALQLAIVEVLQSWGISAKHVVGHSSGEIAAAAAAGVLSYEDAIVIAFYRGQASKNASPDSTGDVGMLAVGLGLEQITTYIGAFKREVEVACINSPNSVTLSGQKSALETLQLTLTKDQHFARMLRVNLAYHSRFMSEVGQIYGDLMKDMQLYPAPDIDVNWISSVDVSPMRVEADAAYWKSNMVSPVLFSDAFAKMVSSPGAPDFIIEIGPSGALAGPISQIKNSLPEVDFTYASALARGADSEKAIFDVAGKLFLRGSTISLAKVNENSEETNQAPPSTIVDLPNYVWNHSTPYWHESEASKDWRFRKYPVHDLLGTKVLGVPWKAPTWKKVLSPDDILWLKDHKMGPDMIFPAAGYVALAVEAIYQLTQSEADATDLKPVTDFGYTLRNVKFGRALLFDEKMPSKIYLSLSPLQGFNDTWYDFNVSSLHEENWSDHCQGSVRLDNRPHPTDPAVDLEPLRNATKGSLWYKQWNSIGCGFGEGFQKLKAVEACPGSKASRALVSLEPPATAYPVQSQYSMHPACIDSCFQSLLPSVWEGKRSATTAVLVPASIDEIYIGPQVSTEGECISVAFSEYSGRGRSDQAKNYLSHTSVYNPKSRDLLLKVSGLHYHQLDVSVDLQAAHVYTGQQWKPDISFATESQLQMSCEHDLEGFQVTLELMAHKYPNMRVAEVNLSASDTSSYWLESSTRSYQYYTFASTDAKALLTVQSEYESRRNTSFTLVDFANLSLSTHDLVIVKTPTPQVMQKVVENVRSLVSDDGYLLLIEQSPIPNPDASVKLTNGEAAHHESQQIEAYQSAGFDAPISLPTASQVSVSFSKADLVGDTIDKPKLVDIVRIRELTHPVDNVKAALEDSHWKVTEHSMGATSFTPNSVVLILDELFSPLLKTVTDSEWEYIKEMTSAGRHVLWVTEGSQLDITTPDNALVHGMFRTMRNEDPSLQLTTLDVENSESPASVQAITRILSAIQKKSVVPAFDNEYAERNGIIHVNRVQVDQPLNEAKAEVLKGSTPRTESLHDMDVVAMLRAERVGTLDSLQFSAMSTGKEPVKSGCIEIDIHAAALNFKDVAVTMGIVPENEYLLGLEGAGIVQRVGMDVNEYQVGDRVAFLKNGSFANKIQVPVERAHLIPPTMSFQAAATMPLVFLTSYYSLFSVGGLQRGQTLLIHSATGGVGLACIQLANYAGAEIYATAGNDVKRDYLHDVWGISRDHIFSSRTNDFASAIMKQTRGKGIDVIINSLTGELLDETWRICADGGNMVEIGKRDIVARNYLSMEPFDRNCSYRAVDFSYVKNITDQLIADLLEKIFTLARLGNVTPIDPVTSFAFDNIPAAFAHMRSGRHIGKIVVSRESEKAVQVPVRPCADKLSLRRDMTYLIVGGLKGLCGSLAVFLAEYGAAHITVISRSGVNDETSRSVIAACRSLGCLIDDVKADVSVEHDVQAVFEKAKMPVGGIIQGAMVLRDKPYESMSSTDFHTTISSKVAGTWNLHNLSRSHNSPLSFFTLLSSVSGVIGQRGQANYAAANVYLDAFASYRRSLGLPANAVDLGVIEDVGYVANAGDGLANRFDVRVWTGISEAVLHNIIFYSTLQQQPGPINASSASQLITGIAVPQPTDSPLASDPRFSHLFIGGNDPEGVSGKGTADSSKEVQALLLLTRSGGDVTAIQGAAVEAVSRQFQRMLRLEEQLEPARALSVYGIDSLSAVEFRNWARTELGADISTLEITSAASLSSLCEKIVEKMMTAVKGS